MNNPNVESKGVTALSPLFRIPAPFNVIFHAPSDEFHLVKEGVGKMMIKRLFEDKRTVLTREILSRWSTSYEGLMVFSETARYTRLIDTGAMKGNELGIVIYASFPVLVSILAQQESERWEHVQRAVAVFTFLVRLYNVDEGRYREALRKLDLTLVRGERLSTMKLHEYFYQDFMFSCCSE